VKLIADALDATVFLARRSARTWCVAACAVIDRARPSSNALDEMIGKLPNLSRGLCRVSTPEAGTRTIVPVPVPITRQSFLRLPATGGCGHEATSGGRCVRTAPPQACFPRRDGTRDRATGASWQRRAEFTRLAEPGDRFLRFKATYGYSFLLVERADAALYSAKNSGKNQVRVCSADVERQRT